MDELLAAWLNRMSAHLITWPLARHVRVEYAEAGHEVAQCRFRVELLDGSLLQCVERVRYQAGELHTEKYSFHWQTPDGGLISRWDNAPHHRELAGFPHHLHEWEDSRVRSHPSVTLFSLTELVEARFPPIHPS